MQSLPVQSTVILYMSGSRMDRSVSIVQTKVGTVRDYCRNPIHSESNLIILFYADAHSGTKPKYELVEAVHRFARDSESVYGLQVIHPWNVLISISGSLIAMNLQILDDAIDHLIVLSHVL